jgi:hypothetical protein
VVLSGERPLQKKIITARMSGKDSPAGEVTLRDTNLQGTVTLGNQPLPNASLVFSTNLQEWGELWSGRIDTDSEGNYSTPIWESGAFSVKVAIPNESQPFRGLKTIGSDETEYWDIALPNASIEGRVTDAETGQPVAGVQVRDEGSTAPGQLPTRIAITDDDGRFRFRWLAAGTHLLHARADGYLETETKSVPLSEGTEGTRVDFRLGVGSPVYLRFVDEGDAAIPNVFLFDWFGRDGWSSRRPLVASATGELRYPMRREDHLRVWAVTEDGSFAGVELRGGEETSPDRPSRITIPHATVPLSILAERGQHPAAGLSFVIAYEGRLIPPGMLDQIAAIQRVRLTTGPDGRMELPHAPPGRYQLWPYTTYDDFMELSRRIRETPAAGIAFVGTVPAEVKVTVP